MKRLVASAFLIVLSSMETLPGQIQDGRIVGTVFDPNKAIVPNARVVITNSATNEAHELITNSAGDFVLTPAIPGFYHITVSAKGFGAAEIKSVEVIVGQSTRVDVDLRVGDVATTIEVAATTPLLNTESGTLGQEVTNKQIVGSPFEWPQFL